MYHPLSIYTVCSFRCIYKVMYTVYATLSIYTLSPTDRADGRAVWAVAACLLLTLPVTPFKYSRCDSGLNQLIQLRVLTTVL